MANALGTGTHKRKETYANEVLAIARAEMNIYEDFSTDYEQDEVTGQIMVPTRNGEVKVSDYDILQGIELSQSATDYLPLPVDKDYGINELIDGYEAEAVPDNLRAQRVESAGYSIGLKKENMAIECLMTGTVSSDTNALTTDDVYKKIVAEVTGRAKHLYSIYRKMQRDNKTLDQIYDLFALRIIVNSVKDCYAALGVVHELYNPMPGRFKDYISVPKPNMYQSLHTTLIGPKGTPFEVQIRTWDMHRIAEYGIAAHWAYKEASFMGGKKANVVVNQDKLSWLRETLEWQKDMQDPQEFLNTLKTELFEDEVYVFTPKGKIQVFPRGATPIDFAYSIHEEIGNHMTGCKINSKMMPIVTKLKNGDIVEIITSDKSKGPSRDWLKFIKSSTAKTRIQQWFKKNERVENIARGKDFLEKEVKKIGMSYPELFRPEFVEAALERYKYNSADDMFASVGFGTITANKIVSRVLEEYRKVHKEENLEEKIEELTKEKTNNKPSTSGVIVKGIDNCLVKLSKCCNPVPGDEIVGYITKGRGVSVHRKDCKNVKDLVSEENRMIDVSWYTDKPSSYNVDVVVFSNDRDGLLADIIATVTAEKTPMISVTSKVSKERIVLTELTLEVSNIAQLNSVLKAIRKIDSVYEVRRNK